MLIVQTPMRMSFFGGGTDVKEYYENYGGAVISTTFDKYCYHNIRKYPPFFDHKSQFRYSKIEKFDEALEVEHPAVRETLKYLNIKNIQITYDADLPARSGLGTSSSFEVGLLNGLHSLNGEFIDKMSLAKEAIYVERELCNEEGGVQDQLAVSIGGLNKYIFNSDGFSYNPIIISKERKQELCDNLLLFFTGFTRFSSEISKEQISNTKNKLSELHEIKNIVNEAEKILTGNKNLDEFGKLLDYNWQLKKTLAKSISNSDIDNLYTHIVKNGAIGGKLLGAGGGGFLLIYANKDKHKNIIEKTNLLHIPFEFESSGTKVLYYKPEKFEY
jgi:GHMP kinase